jgi:tRNA (adenine57-N1/adenine58-N1)-methyltransferase
VPHAAQVLRSGGIYLSFVPTIPQVVQTVEALERATVFGMVETFETLLRTWSIQGRSVRPDHRMVAHSGFITVARKIESGMWTAAHAGEHVVETADIYKEREDQAP